MPSVEIVDLVKTYRTGRRQSVKAVDGVSLEVPDGRILTLLGPSGCGKTTTLRCVAGLERPDDGEIRFDGRVVFSRIGRTFTPADRRNVGMVFQSYAVWPHLTVFENVAYPMQVRGVSRGETRERVRAALAMVGLDGLADRAVPHLSGGQQQRVALARALVYQPDVLLLDEPLSNLDAKTREQVREDMHALQRQLGLTTIYVTHDQLEALTFSDVIAVMDAGRVVEIGSPERLYTRPETRFTAAFLGEISYLAGRVTAADGEAVTMATACGPLRCATHRRVAPGASVLAGFRPEHVSLSVRRPVGAENAFEGTVVSVRFEGGRVKYRVALGGLTVLAEGPPRFSAGDRLHAMLDPAQVILLPDLPADVSPAG